jgi:hypothetical protein
MNKPEHPGKIIYIDGNSNEVLREQNIEDVPESLHYVQTDKGLVPVVKVVATTYENRRFIRQYGPDDEFLSETVQIK